MKLDAERNGWVVVRCPRHECGIRFTNTTNIDDDDDEEDDEE